jgi:hypothetical protein
MISLRFDEAIVSFRTGLAVTHIPLEQVVRLRSGIAEALLLKDTLGHRDEHLDQAIAALEEAFSAALSGEADLPVQYRLGRHEDTARVAPLCCFA